MDPFLIGALSSPAVAVVALLRAAGALFALQGKPQIGGAFTAAGAALQAGRNIDAHMQEIADAIESGAGPAAWSDIGQRATAETAEFLKP